MFIIYSFRKSDVLEIRLHILGAERNPNFLRYRPGLKALQNIYFVKTKFTIFLFGLTYNKFVFEKRTSKDSEVYDMQTWELLKMFVAPHFGDWAIKGANHFLGIFKVFKRLLV